VLFSAVYGTARHASEFPHLDRYRLPDRRALCPDSFAALLADTHHNTPEPKQTEGTMTARRRGPQGPDTHRTGTRKIGSRTGIAALAWPSWPRWLLP